MFRVLGLFSFSSCGDEKRLHKTTQYILLPTCCVREEEEEEDMATAHDKKRATAIISILLISSALVAGVSIALAERRNNRFKSIIGEETTTRSSPMFRILRAKRTPFLKGWKRRKKEERGLFDVIEDDQMGAPKIVRLEEEEEEEEEKEEEESL